MKKILKIAYKTLAICLKSIWKLMVHIWQCSTSKLLDQLFNGKHFWKFEYLRKKLPKYNFFFTWLAIKYLMDQHWSYILKWFSHALEFTPIEQISWNPTHFWAVSSTKMSVCVYTPCICNAFFLEIRCWFSPFSQAVNEFTIFPVHLPTLFLALYIAIFCQMTPATRF